MSAHTCDEVLAFIRKGWQLQHLTKGQQADVIVAVVLAEHAGHLDSLLSRLMALAADPSEVRRRLIQRIANGKRYRVTSTIEEALVLSDLIADGTTCRIPHYVSEGAV